MISEADSLLWGLFANFCFVFVFFPHSYFCIVVAHCCLKCLVWTGSSGWISCSSQHLISPLSKLLFCGMPLHPPIFLCFWFAYLASTCVSILKSCCLLGCSVVMTYPRQSAVICGFHQELLYLTPDLSWMCGIVLGLALIHVEVNLIYAFSYSSSIFPEECLKDVLSSFLFCWYKKTLAKFRIFFWKQALFGVVLLLYSPSLIFQFFRDGNLDFYICQ